MGTLFQVSGRKAGVCLGQEAAPWDPRGGASSWHGPTPAFLGPPARMLLIKGAWHRQYSGASQGEGRSLKNLLYFRCKNPGGGEKLFCFSTFGGGVISKTKMREWP